MNLSIINFKVVFLKYYTLYKLDMMMSPSYLELQHSKTIDQIEYFFGVYFTGE